MDTQWPEIFTRGKVSVTDHLKELPGDQLFDLLDEAETKLNLKVTFENKAFHFEGAWENVFRLQSLVNRFLGITSNLPEGNNTEDEIKCFDHLDSSLHNGDRCGPIENVLSTHTDAEDVFKLKTENEPVLMSNNLALQKSYSSMPSLEPVTSDEEEYSKENSLDITEDKVHLQLSTSSITKDNDHIVAIPSGSKVNTVSLSGEYKGGNTSIEDITAIHSNMIASGNVDASELETGNNTGDVSSYNSEMPHDITEKLKVEDMVEESAVRPDDHTLFEISIENKANTNVKDDSECLETKDAGNANKEKQEYGDHLEHSNKCTLNLDTGDGTLDGDNKTHYLPVQSSNRGDHMKLAVYIDTEEEHEAESAESATVELEPKSWEDWEHHSLTEQTEDLCAENDTSKINVVESDESDDAEKQYTENKDIEGNESNVIGKRDGVNEFRNTVARKTLVNLDDNETDMIENNESHRNKVNDSEKTNENIIEESDKNETHKFDSNDISKSEENISETDKSETNITYEKETNDGGSHIKLVLSLSEENTGENILDMDTGHGQLAADFFHTSHTESVYGSAYYSALDIVINGTGHGEEKKNTITSVSADNESGKISLLPDDLQASFACLEEEYEAAKGVITCTDSDCSSENQSDNDKTKAKIQSQNLSDYDEDSNQIEIDVLNKDIDFTGLDKNNHSLRVEILDDKIVEQSDKNDTVSKISVVEFDESDDVVQQENFVDKNEMNRVLHKCSNSYDCGNSDHDIDTSQVGGIKASFETTYTENDTVDETAVSQGAAEICCFEQYIDSTTWLYMEKVYRDEIKKMEQLYQVTFCCEFMSTDVDSDVQLITMKTRSLDNNIDKAVEAFCDLYGTVQIECSVEVVHVYGWNTEPSYWKGIKEVNSALPNVAIRDLFEHHKKFLFIGTSLEAIEATKVFRKAVGMPPPFSFQTEKRDLNYKATSYRSTDDIGYGSADAEGGINFSHYRNTFPSAGTKQKYHFSDNKVKHTDKEPKIHNTLESVGATGATGLNSMTNEKEKQPYDAAGNVSDISKTMRSVLEVHSIAENSEFSDKESISIIKSTKNESSHPGMQPTFDLDKEIEITKLSKQQSQEIQLLYKLLDIDQVDSDDIENIIAEILSGSGTSVLNGD